MQFAHEKAEAAIESLTTDAADAVIAAAIADYMLTGKRPPVRLALNHNAKAAPCPLRIDRPGLKHSSVMMHSIPDARVWITEALLRGYEVSCPTFKGLDTRSIAGERRSMEYRARMQEWRAKREAGADNDDEIPF